MLSKKLFAEVRKSNGNNVTGYNILPKTHSETNIGHTVLITENGYCGTMQGNIYDGNMARRWWIWFLVV